MSKELYSMISNLESKGIDPMSISIGIEFEKNLYGLIGRLEPEDLTTLYNITVTYTKDFESDKKIIIGNSICRQIDTLDKLTNEELPIFDIADSISGDMLCIISPFIDEKGDIKPQYWGMSMLYIESIYIKPEFRGKGIGSIVLKFIVEELLNFSPIITIIPNPVEIKDKESNEFKKELRKLIDLYESLGFVNMDNVVWQYEG